MSDMTLDRVDMLPPMIESLLNRASTARLAEPGPSPEHVELLLRVAANAPDHGKLRPWRFVIVNAEARGRFGHLMAQSLHRRDPSAAPELLERERDKAMRAPTIIVAAAK